MLDSELEAILKDAFWEGNSTKILEILSGESKESLLKSAALKIVDALNFYLASLDQNEAIVKNVLKIITDLISIFINDKEQCIVIAECMLRIATEEIVSAVILKCAVYNLNLLIKETEYVLNWLKNDESLEGFLLILGRRLPSVGDFECQSHIFETLYYIIYDNANKYEWIQSWFTDDEKTRSLLLNWNLKNFTVKSRKILNQINRREMNPRTYAFAATAVYFGNEQLKKLDGLEFWIDFNYDSESISFFCKDFELEDQDNAETWETVIISPDNVETYSVQKKEDVKSVELCITLNCPCGDLLVSAMPSFDTNLVRMIFWIYVDISSHLKVIFGEPDSQALSSQKIQGYQRTRKVSHSADAIGIQDQNNTSTGEKIRKISASDVVEISADDCVEREKRISDSTELISLSDHMRNFDTNTVHKNSDSSSKRKVSCSSLFLKESDSERNSQMNDKTRLSTNEDERDSSKHCSKENNSQIFSLERKSSSALCAIDYTSDDSDNLIIDMDGGAERFKEISESFFKKKHEIAYGKHLDGLKTITENFIENKNINSTKEVSRSNIQKFVKNEGIEESFSYDLSENPLQLNKTKTGSPFKDFHIRNSNESVKLSQKDKKSISSESCQNSQKRAKKVDDSTKISQSVSDEAYVISPTPAITKKSGKTAMLTQNFFKDFNSLEAQSYVLNHVQCNEYEKNISHKTIFDGDTEDFKNLYSSQNKNVKDDVSNNQQKKIRLYNINRDPVYDVPPSEQKKVNATPIQKSSSPFVNVSLKNQNKSLLLNSMPFNEDQDFCETKIIRRKSTECIEIKKKNNIIYEAPEENDKSRLLENNILEKGPIKDQEVQSPKQYANENDFHLPDKDAASSEPRKKKLKKNNEERKVVERKSSYSKRSKRESNDVEKEVISEKAPPKKQRRAAIKAMKKNKIMLEQRESEHTSEVFSEKSSNINHSNSEIEEVFCTPPTKPVKKRRLKSIFLTDTETGSSNVSWIGGKKSCLFETPEKRYSKGFKSKQPFKIQSPKKKTYKFSKENSKRKQNSKLSLNGFIKESKSGLSDLENFELVVEKKTDHKKSSNLNRKHFSFENVSKAINAAMEGKIDTQYKEPNNSNIEASKYNDIEGFDYNEGKVKEDLISTEKSLINIHRKDIAIDANMVTMKLNLSSSKERHSRSFEFLCKKKDNSSNPELHKRSVSNDVQLSNSVKRKLDNFSTLKDKSKRNRKDSSDSRDIVPNAVIYTDNEFDNRNSIILDENSQNVSLASAQQISKSLNVIKDKSCHLSTRKKTILTDLQPTCLSPNVGVLTEQSLSSLVSENDEAAGKEFHLQRYLKDLSGKSKIQEYFEHDAVISQSNKTSKSNISSGSGILLKHSTSENCLSQEIKILDLSATQNCMDIEKKKLLTSFEESNDKSKISSGKDLQKFLFLDNHLDSGLGKESFERYLQEDNHQKFANTNIWKTSKQLSVLHVLGVTTENLSQRLLKTLQKHFYSFNVKIAASREKLLATANNLVSKENYYNHKDLQQMVKVYKMNRIQAEKSLNKILSVGQDYFEAEKKLDTKMKKFHKKALKKFATSIKLAGAQAVKTLENQAAAKTEVLLKNILKKIEHL